MHVCATYVDVYYSRGHYPICDPVTQSRESAPTHTDGTPNNTSETKPLSVHHPGCIIHPRMKKIGRDVTRDSPTGAMP